MTSRSGDSADPEGVGEEELELPSFGDGAFAAFAHISDPGSSSTSTSTSDVPTILIVFFFYSWMIRMIVIQQTGIEADLLLYKKKINPSSPRLALRDSRCGVNSKKTFFLNQRINLLDLKYLFLFI